MGVRINAAFSYLAPARSRPNMQLMPDTLVDRICVNNGRAVGVRLADGRELRAREVILYVGAYASPAILLRSGFGPAAHLQEHGIAVIANRPGVGTGLLDHPFLGSIFTLAIKPEYGPAAPSISPMFIEDRSRQAKAEIDLHLYQSQHFDMEAGSSRLGSVWSTPSRAARWGLRPPIPRPP